MSSDRDTVFMDILGLEKDTEKKMVIQCCHS